MTFSDGNTVSAKVVGSDPESDIAVLKLDANKLTPIEFGDSDAVQVGDPVLAIGSPLALANTVTSGIVSAVDRPIEAGEAGGPTRYYAAIQTDAAVNHGNSGGPLVDAGGRVIGINSVIKSLASDQEQAGNMGLAFAIPINQAKRLAQDIMDTGKARRTVIGAELEASYRGPNGGVRLQTVEAGGPAANAGLKVGDVLTRIGGAPLEEPERPDRDGPQVRARHRRQRRIPARRRETQRPGGARGRREVVPAPPVPPAGMRRLGWTQGGPDGPGKHRRWELIVVILVGLFIFGPDKLPKAISDGVRMLRQLREMARNATGDLSRELGTDIQLEDLNPKTFLRKHVLSEDDEAALRKPLQGIYDDLKGTTDQVKGDLTSTAQALDVHQPEPRPPAPRPAVHRSTYDDAT